VLPLVLLLSPTYRAEVAQRLAHGARKGFGARSWASFLGVLAAIVFLAIAPALIILVGMPASIAYLRGRAGTYAERKAVGPPDEPQARTPVTERARQAAAAAAQRAIDLAQAAVDQGRTAAAAPRSAPAPAARPAAPRAGRSTPPPQPSGAARGGDEQPRRRWWQAAGSGGNDPSSPKEPKFRTRSGGDGHTNLTARRKTITGDDGKSHDVVEIGIDASFRVPRSGSPVVQVLELFDVTEPGRGPVAIHRWGEDEFNTGGPYRTSSQSTVQHTSARLTKTVTIGLQSLHAPYRGDRTARARFTMHRPRSPGEPIAEGWVEFPYREEVVGYVEAPQLRLRTEAGIVTAGFAAIIADGKVDPGELSLLERFITNRYERRPDGGHLEVAARAALNDAKLRVRSGTSASELLQQAGRDLADADEGPRKTAYDLAVQIMAVDGRITEDELARLNELAQVLRLDAETTATLRNRHTDVGMFEGEDVDPLGVPAGTADEQRAFLMGELKKWRSVLTHPDAAKRQQAQETMDLITARIAELDRAAAGTA
jgi:tellurite resistance protein